MKENIIMKTYIPFLPLNPTQWAFKVMVRLNRSQGLQHRFPISFDIKDHISPQT